jgi:hypothetical protein
MEAQSLKLKEGLKIAELNREIILSDRERQEFNTFVK